MTELVGQDSVWNECINQFHTPTHIFITGPAGYGKTTIMRQFLQTYSNQQLEVRLDDIQEFHEFVRDNINKISNALDEKKL